MILGEWDHFLYVGKIAFFGWAFHFGKLKGRYALSLFSTDAHLIALH